MSLKNIWTDPVWSKVIATGICALLVTAFGWWGDLWAYVGAGWRYLTASVEVPRWLVGALSSWAVFNLLGSIARRVAASTATPAEDWSSYLSDEFFGMRWRWGLSEGLPYQVSPFCLNCDYQLDPQNVSSYHAIEAICFQCDHCGRTSARFDESWHSLERRVKRSIEQKLRTGTWQKTGA